MIRRTRVHARSANSLRAANALELAGPGFDRTVIDMAVAYSGVELPAEIAA
jgi:hypothetical protein